MPSHRLAFVVLAVLALAAAGARAGRPKWHELTAGYTFDAYCRDFGKAHRRRSAAWAVREAAFAASLRTVLAHNAQAPPPPFRMGVNGFSDWTDAEWAAYNRHRELPAQVAAATVPLAVPRAPATGLPASVDYRRREPPVLTSVKFQGNCGSCWAHAAAESVETYYALMTNGTLPTLSQQQLTSCTPDMNGCGGGSFWEAWTYVTKSANGLWSDWVYPYEDFLSNGSTQPCRAGAVMAKVEQIASNPGLASFWSPHVNVTGFHQTPANDANATMAALATIGPLAISVAAAPWRHYESGVFVNPAGSPDEWRIDHAAQLVGYGVTDAADGATPYWIVRNSWSAWFGEEGFIRLARPAVEPCGLWNGDTVCGTSGLLLRPAYPDVADIGNE